MVGGPVWRRYPDPQQSLDSPLGPLYRVVLGAAGVLDFPPRVHFVAGEEEHQGDDDTTKLRPPIRLGTHSLARPKIASRGVQDDGTIIIQSIVIVTIAAIITIKPKHDVRSHNPLGPRRDRAALVPREVVKKQGGALAGLNLAHQLPRAPLVKVGLATMKPLVEVDHEGEEGGLRVAASEGAVGVDGRPLALLVPHHPDPLVHGDRAPAACAMWSPEAVAGGEVGLEAGEKLAGQGFVVKVNLGVQPQLPMRLAIFEREK